MTEHPNAEHDDSIDPDREGESATQGPVPTEPENASDTGPKGQDVAANPVPSPENADED